MPQFSFLMTEDKVEVHNLDSNKYVAKQRSEIPSWLFNTFNADPDTNSLLLSRKTNVASGARLHHWFLYEISAQEARQQPSDMV